MEVNAVHFGGASYPTVCVRAFDAVQDLVQSSVACCDQFAAVLRARIAAEERYGRDLARAASLPIAYRGGGQLQAAFDQMKVRVRACMCVCVSLRVSVCLRV
jgi:hypothetical protein